MNESIQIYQRAAAGQDGLYYYVAVPKVSITDTQTAPSSLPTTQRTEKIGQREEKRATEINKRGEEERTKAEKKKKGGRVLKTVQH